MGRFRNILLVAGARPNFMKVAPLLRALNCYPNQFHASLVHTGQHYDAEMSDIFFEELGLPRPDWFLGVGSATHAEQTARVMIEFERVCLEDRPDLAIVVGDVNSTMACAITAKKLCVPVAHVEAGLRSWDWSMPEEVNRVVTDAISDLLFTPSRDADVNLAREGVAPDRIHFVGNVMIDCLLTLLPKATKREALDRFGVQAGGYAALTLHRPSNVDDPEVLSGIVNVLIDVSRLLPIVWPIHPRARKNLEAFGLLRQLEKSPGLKLAQPIGYLDMLALSQGARLILTDSGGLQEEATILRVPCITLRENTERPVTIECGCNQLVGNEPSRIRAAVYGALDSARRDIRVPELWDGHAAERIVQILIDSAP
jgi:UDP-N-acetylglucosamine 2-epimerase (non-hydrolysing)